MFIQTLNLNLKGHVTLSLTFENELIMVSKCHPFLLIFVLEILRILVKILMLSRERIFALKESSKFINKQRYI